MVKIGQDNVNGILNDKLRAAGSTNRVFFAAVKPGVYAGVYGPLTTEVQETIGEFSPFRIYMAKPTTIVGFGTGYLAVNDQVSTILVIGENLRTNLTLSSQRPPSYAFFNAQQTAVATAFKKEVPINEANLQIMSEIVLAHERGHYAIAQQHGLEMAYVEQSMNTLGQYKLDQMTEVNADLYALEYITGLSKTDPQKARQAFLIWTTLRGPERAEEKAITNLLLSSVSGSGSPLVIDWNKLAKNTAKLKTVIQTSFAEIKRNIQLDIVSKTRGGQGAATFPPEKLNTAYEAFVSEMMAGFIKDHPEYTPIRARQESVARLVQFALDAVDQVYRQKMEVSYAVEIEAYARKVDEFFLQDMGLPQACVPFDAVNIEVKTLPQ